MTRYWIEKATTLTGERFYTLYANFDAANDRIVCAHYTVKKEAIHALAFAMDREALRVDAIRQAKARADEALARVKGLLTNGHE